MNIPIKSAKKRLKSFLISRVFSHSGDEYQRTRFPTEKFNLIIDRLDLDKISNVLDVGCNEGYIAAEFAKRGKFAVGIDVGPLFLNHLLTELDDVYGRPNPAYGVFPLTEENVSTIPEFDLILLLSVHHQWTKRYGDTYTQRLVRRLIGKARCYFVIEFASRASKYGFETPQFKDNDEESVRGYAQSWLSGLQVPGRIDYLGKNRESTGKAEPYRYVFLISKE